MGQSQEWLLDDRGRDLLCGLALLSGQGLSRPGDSDHHVRGLALETRVSFRRSPPPPVTRAADICQGHPALGQHAAAARSSQGYSVLVGDVAVYGWLRPTRVGSGAVSGGHRRDASGLPWGRERQGL